MVSSQPQNAMMSSCILYRELNEGPDAVAAAPLNIIVRHKSFMQILIEFDGSSGTIASGAAFCVWRTSKADFKRLEFSKLAITGSLSLAVGASAIDADLVAMYSVV